MVEMVTLVERPNTLEFWSKEAECLTWYSPWSSVLEWDPPHAKWFVGGTLNASFNCLDRHHGTPTWKKTALHWEGEKGDVRSFTYEELYEAVNSFSGALKALGVKKGDRVAIYLPMIPEAVIAMLSCARIGAIHTVVFAGFSSTSLKDRIEDAKAKVLITADGGFRKGKIVPLKQMADEALLACSSIASVVVVAHTLSDVSMKEGRDSWYNDLVRDKKAYCAPEVMEAEDQLFILYTSGSTGKPKGVIHTTGGYMVGAYRSMERVFGLEASDIYWCTADVGWITGHTYVVYGPLSYGATQLIYEGAPDYPEKDQFWRLIEKHRVSVLYTAPTAIRTFMKWGEEWLLGKDLSSLRLLGSVGEPINPEAWNWYFTHVGQRKCPIVDTWWQTETGSIMMAPLPPKLDQKPGSAGTPLPGIDVAILDDKGQEAESGNLVIKSPWPSMLRGIYNDPERFYDSYWKLYNGRYYFTGDGAKIDEENSYWLMGRMDDVINVSGHRLGTMEIESALIEVEDVAEAAVIGIADPIKGQCIIAFVTLKDHRQIVDSLEKRLKDHITKQIGALARPEKILFIYDLPKTRSGKIMRRLLRDIAEGRLVGDVTTLYDPEVLETLKLEYQHSS